MHFEWTSTIANSGTTEYHTDITWFPDDSIEIHNDAPYYVSMYAFEPNGNKRHQITLTIEILDNTISFDNIKAGTYTFDPELTNTVYDDVTSKFVTVSRIPFQNISLITRRLI